MERFGEIDEIENVLLEAGSSEADRRFEEAIPDSRIKSAGVRYFVDVGSSDFADGGEGVDRGDTLSEKGVGSLIVVLS